MVCPQCSQTETLGTPATALANLFVDAPQRTAGPGVHSLHRSLGGMGMAALTPDPTHRRSQALTCPLVWAGSAMCANKLVIIICPPHAHSTAKQPVSGTARIVVTSSSKHNRSWHVLLSTIQQAPYQYQPRTAHYQRMSKPAHETAMCAHAVPQGDIICVLPLPLSNDASPPGARCA